MVVFGWNRRKLFPRLRERRQFTVVLLLAAIAVATFFAHSRFSSRDVDPARDYLTLVAEARRIMDEIKIRPQFDRIAVAREKLEAALRREPDRREALEALGDLHIAAGFWRRFDSFAFREHKIGARDAFQKLVDRDPANLKDRGKLILAQYALSDFKPMHENLRKACESANRPDLLARLGDQPPHDEKDAAILENDIRRLLDLGILDDHSSIVFRFFLGELLVSQGRKDDAEATLKAVTADYDEWIHKNGNQYFWGCPYESLGNFYAQNGSPQKSLAFYKKHADTTTVESSKQTDTAIKCFRAGDYECALTYSSRAAESNSDSTSIRALYALALLGANRRDDAKSVIDQMVSGTVSRWIHASGADGREVALGHWYLSGRQFESAQDAFAHVIGGLSLSKLMFHVDIIPQTEQIPGFFYEMAYLGWAWSRTFENDHDDALRAYEAILARHPNYLQALLGKGTSLFALGDLNAARTAYLDANARYPDNPQALTQLGLIDLEQGRPADAEKRFDSAAAVAGGQFACPYTGLGLVYLAQGDESKAREQFEQAILKQPDRGYKEFNALARIYAKEGRIAEARALLETSLRHYPAQTEAGEILATFPPETPNP